jgi:hypothetical protein
MSKPGFGMMMAALVSGAVLAAGAAAPAVARVKFAAPEGFKLQKDGTLIHEKSGTHFPIVYQGFGRTNNYAYDPGGKNVSVVYTAQMRGQMAEARIALVHILMMSAHEHYAALSPVIGTYFQDMHFSKVKSIEDGALQVPGLAADAAWQGRFRAVRNGQPYLLSLTTVSFGYWSARITAAYPAAQAADAQARITALIGEIQATGPKHH